MSGRNVFTAPRLGDVLRRGRDSKKARRVLPGGVVVLCCRRWPPDWSGASYSELGEDFYTLGQWAGLEGEGWEVSE